MLFNPGFISKRLLKTFFSRTHQGLFKLNKSTMGEVKQRKGCCFSWEPGLNLKSVFVLLEYLQHPYSTVLPVLVQPSTPGSISLWCKSAQLPRLQPHLTPAEDVARRFASSGFVILCRWGASQFSLAAGDFVFYFKCHTDFPGQAEPL